MPSPNNRIFYACQAIGFSEYKTSGVGAQGTYIAAHGVQSVGVNTTFNLEQAFELGQISIYENIEGIPDVEVTVEKVLDGYLLLYQLATSGAGGNYTDGQPLVTCSKQRTNVALGIYSDENEYVSGTAPTQVLMSGMYLNSVSYTFPTDGNSTESVTLVGNHKQWFRQDEITSNGGWHSGNNLMAGGNGGVFRLGNSSASDMPKASGGIQRREDVLMNSSIMPLDIFGVLTTGTLGNGVGGAASGNNWQVTGGIGKPIAHIQNITISTDLGREDILELGQKDPYYKAATYPVEVTSEFEVIAISGDWVNAYSGENDNTSEVSIKVVLRDGSSFDLGHKNRLSSVNYTGGDAGGGNATITYSYTGYNDLTIKGPSKFRPNTTTNP